MLQIKKGCDVITVSPRGKESEQEAAARLATIWGGSGVLVDGVPFLSPPKDPVLAREMLHDLEHVSGERLDEESDDNKPRKVRHK